MSSYINKFIDYIENIYMTINIHRAIIIVKNDYEALELNDCLIKNNHTPLIINSHINNINYDYRLFIISDINNLKKFNKNLYNFIAIY